MMFAERPDDLSTLLADMNSTTRAQSLGFCGVEDDQTFGTDGELDLNDSYYTHTKATAAVYFTPNRNPRLVRRELSP